MLCELRFVFRQLAKSPGLTAVLAIGIGTNTAFCSVVKTLLSPSPFGIQPMQSRMFAADEDRSGGPLGGLRGAFLLTPATIQCALQNST